MTMRASCGRGRRIASIVLATILSPGIPMVSAAWQGSKTFQACIASAGGNDPDMGVCTRDELERQDKLLNAEYAARLKVANAKLKSAIVTSQRAWLGYRDSTCRAEGALYDGGTMEPLTFAECEARLTAERLDWLKGLTP